jgi:hypothetical protein
MNHLKVSDHELHFLILAMERHGKVIMGKHDFKKAQNPENQTDSFQKYHQGFIALYHKLMTKKEDRL